MKKAKTGTIIAKLRSMSNKSALKGMERFGIDTKYALGISIPDIRGIAKSIGTDHGIALGLWESGIHEARILASFVDDPALVTERQMERWVNDFNSWDICDQCCSSLFDRTRFAYSKALEWTERDREYVKRAGFTMMAALSVHNKSMSDKDFERFIPIIERECLDERNFVRKAVNWALRQIGKRNRRLNRIAVASAKRIKAKDLRSARWIANDALRELTGDAVQDRLRSRE
jgi:3-methyladenine DNA glycosylase AlkD